MSRNVTKSTTPTSAKSNRFSKLLKRKSKKSKSAAHLKFSNHLPNEDQIPPVLLTQRKSSPFLTTNTNVANNIERYPDSCSRNIRALSHHQIHKYNSKQIPPSPTNKRKPPPPPKSSHRSLHHQNSPKSISRRSSYAHNDININIDINKNHHKSNKRSKQRRSRHNSMETDSPLSTSRSPQSPAARYISHMPRESIEHKINLKQLLFEMIEMKRQIKSLKKDVKHLKTENDLWHRRITCLEQTFDNQPIHTQNESTTTETTVLSHSYVPSQTSTYSHSNFRFNLGAPLPPDTIIQPTPTENMMSMMGGSVDLGPTQIQNSAETRPKSISTMHSNRSCSLSSVHSSSLECEELDLNESGNGNIPVSRDGNEDMETKLSVLSHRLSNANVFSKEYRSLQNELEMLIQQNADCESQNNEFYEEEETESAQFNDPTVVIKSHKKQKQKRLYSKHNKSIDGSDINNFKNCTLSRRTTLLSRRTTNQYKNKQSIDANAENDCNQMECESTMDEGNQGMQIVD